MAWREVNLGVPLGSGERSRWDLDFNEVLEAAVPIGINIVCYADDTLLVTKSRRWNILTDGNRNRGGHPANKRGRPGSRNNKDRDHVDARASPTKKPPERECT